MVDTAFGAGMLELLLLCFFGRIARLGGVFGRFWRLFLRQCPCTP